MPWQSLVTIHTAEPAFQLPVGPSQEWERADRQDLTRNTLRACLEIRTNGGQVGAVSPKPAPTRLGLPWKHVLPTNKDRFRRNCAYFFEHPLARAPEAYTTLETVAGRKTKPAYASVLAAHPPVRDVFHLGGEVPARVAELVADPTIAQETDL